MFNLLLNFLPFIVLILLMFAILNKVKKNRESESREELEDCTGIYIISILIPLCGFIVGSVKLAQNGNSKTGTRCIVLGVLSTIICSIITYYILF